VLGAAQTGSGKTLAFALPLLQRLKDARQEWPRLAQALVLVPTRELAVQVGEVLKELAGQLPEPPRVAVVYGGVSINPQMMRLRGGTEVVVATPGRLLDLLEHNALRLDGVRTLVLDEADRLLDMGFADELARVLALLPAQRQNLFFSATFAPAVQQLADELLHEPLRIELPAVGSGAPDIVQRAIEVDAVRRTMLLRHLIKDQGWDQVLVFVATRYATELLTEKLLRAGFQAAALHGELSQGTRTAVLGDFRARRVQVLVATDVAARGIDIVQLPVVVNYDLPRSAVDYVHRIGRTGRAGASGVAVSFISADTEAHFRLIEKRQGVRIEREQIEGFEPTEAATPQAEQADPTGGVKGKRPSKKDKLRAAAGKLA
jgi:superfamily II DNA/RNA helicase